MNTFNVLIVLASLAGLYITYRIRKEKQKVAHGGSMVCIVGADCTKVVFSEYSKFFGLDLEKMGFAYYALTAVMYLLVMFVPTLMTDFVLFVSLGLTFGGLLFSIYLTAIQVFRLKNFCTWCLGSALSSTLIFIFAFIKVLQSSDEFLEYLPQVAGGISLIKITSLAIATLIALYTEFYFFRAPKDSIVDAREHAVVKNLHQINWFVLFLFILGTIGMYLTTPASMISWNILYAEIGLTAAVIFNSLFSSWRIISLIAWIALALINF